MKKERGKKSKEESKEEDWKKLEFLIVDTRSCSKKS